MTKFAMTVMIGIIMKILKTASYKKAIALVKKEQGCKECGNLAVGHDGLCQKCQEEGERSRERYKD